VIGAGDWRLGIRNWYSVVGRADIFFNSPLERGRGVFLL